MECALLVDRMKPRLRYLASPSQLPHLRLLGPLLLIAEYSLVGLHCSFLGLDPRPPCVTCNRVRLLGAMPLICNLARWPRAGTEDRQPGCAPPRQWCWSLSPACRLNQALSPRIIAFMHRSTASRVFRRHHGRFEADLPNRFRFSSRPLGLNLSGLVLVFLARSRS